MTRTINIEIYKNFAIVTGIYDNDEKCIISNYENMRILSKRTLAIDTCRALDEKERFYFESTHKFMHMIKDAIDDIEKMVEPVSFKGLRKELPGLLEF